MRKIIQYLNNHLEDNNKYVCEWLTNYLHTSCAYTKQNIDKTWLKIQPAWPEEVVDYFVYYDRDMAYNHESGRIVCTFKTSTQYEIGLYKFKKYLRHHEKDYIYNID